MFNPNYKRIQDAAWNIGSDFLPLYDHVISNNIISKIINNAEYPHLFGGNEKDINEGYRLYCKFLKDMGYDVAIFEGWLCGVLIDGGALGDHADPAIKTREDFNKYPFDEIKEIFFNRYDAHYLALRSQMPNGMKAIGGVGNGLFEIVQDLTGYENLCIMLYEDPELFDDMFTKMAGMMYEIWAEFVRKYGDDFCVFRFGDDLGFNTQTLLPHDVIRRNLIPHYKKIIDLAHNENKPFLLHSCGNIFPIMEDLITVAGINAKHSNEDGIAPFQEWVDRYGDRIGNFGGVDTDIICKDDTKLIKEYTTDICKKAISHGGIAIGTGNSIPDYVSVEGYLAMNEAVREFRGE